MGMLFELTVIGALAILAAVCDVRTRRVPNMLTFGAAIAAFVVATIHAGPAGLVQSVVGWLVAPALFLPLFALGGMGAGDVKLLAAFGAWLGPISVLWAGLWASLVGGVFAVVVGAWHGYLLEAVRNLGATVAMWRVAGLSQVPAVTLTQSRGPRLADAGPIGLGAIVAVWFGRA